jgi:GT2 family glycosyltransferase
VLRATVVIPTYNRQTHLVTALGCLERQSQLERFEVVVVLDGGSDDSEPWLRSYHAPFELRWRWQTNGGLAAARNRGAEEARHEVLIFLDDDVAAGPQLVAAHLAAHERVPDVIVQGYTPIPIRGGSRGATLVYARSYQQLIAELVRSPGQQWPLWSGNISVRRSTFERIGGFDAVVFRQYGGEDTDFGLRAAGLGVRLLFEPGALGEHRHQVRGGRALARQSFHEGASRVRLACRHQMSLSAFDGCQPAGWLDWLIVNAWTRPRLAEALGSLLIGGLWVADRSPSHAARLLLARMVGRHFRMGGIARTRRELGPGNGLHQHQLPQGAGRGVA